MRNFEQTLLAYARFDEILRIGNIAVAEAQERSRRAGVPNVYCINGRLYYETPAGELTLTDPYVSPTQVPCLHRGAGQA